MKNGTKAFRSILCGTTAFFLSVALTLTALLISMKFTVLNSDYVVFIFKNSNFSESLQAELKDEFISFGSACNIDEEFFDDIFENTITAEKIDSDIEISVRNFYKNDVQTEIEYGIKTDVFEELKKYATVKGYKLDRSVIEELTTISSELEELYGTFVGTFNSSGFKNASHLLARYMPLFNYAIIGLAVFAVLAIIIIMASFKKLCNSLRFLIYAFSGSTLMLLVAPATALIMQIGSKINIADASLYSFVSDFINYIFVSIIIAACIMAVITTILHIVRIKTQNK